MSNHAKSKIVKPIKVHGGKEYLAKTIVNLMPPRCKNPNKPSNRDKGWLHYVEPYFGGGSVMLALNPEGISEVANDRNRNLMWFWETMSSPGLFAAFQRQVEGTPFSQQVYRACKARLAHSAGLTNRAYDFFVVARQSLAGRLSDFAPLSRNRTRRGMNEQASAWWNAVDGLAAVYQRMRRVVVFGEDALSVIRREDGPRTLFYLDPPYLHETRATTNEYGDDEMSKEAHVSLLTTLANIRGRFLLSGYRNNLYKM